MQHEHPTLAQLLDHLFKVRRHATGREYSYREVAAATEGEVSYQAIYRIRTGTNDNPTYNTLMALCLFFQVSPSYFFPQLAEKQFPPLPRPGG
jgi:transcriptional regulator with XRE-family HTH domain